MKETGAVLSGYVETLRARTESRPSAHSGGHKASEAFQHQACNVLGLAQGSVSLNFFLTELTKALILLGQSSSEIAKKIKQLVRKGHCRLFVTTSTSLLIYV